MNTENKLINMEPILTNKEFKEKYPEQYNVSRIIEIRESMRDKFVNPTVENTPLKKW